MKKREQIRFVRELVANVQASIIKVVKSGKVPEEWDGHELRQLIADHFALSSFTIRAMKKRFREYKNTVIVENLTGY